MRLDFVLKIFIILGSTINTIGGSTRSFIWKERIPFWCQSCLVIQLEFWSGLNCFAYKTFHAQYVFRACLWLVWRFERRAFYINSMGAKFILKPLGINRHIESSLFNPPHQVQACTKNILNMKFFVCKTTNSLPNLQLNKRINLMHNFCNSNFHHKTWNDNRHEMQLPVSWDNFQALFKPIHRPEVFVKLKVLTTGQHILHDSIWFSLRKNKTKQNKTKNTNDS